MSDRVDLGHLRRHLVDYDDGMGVYDEATPTVELFAETSRAVLSAPTVRWCNTHGASVEPELGGCGADEIGECTDQTTVALVAVETR